MTPEDFVKAFYKEKEQLLKLYFDKNQETAVGVEIQSLKLRFGKKDKLRKILDLALKDALYTILLGLDGATSIGDKQEIYSLHDETGNELTGGDIQGLAWEYFQEE